MEALNTSSSPAKRVCGGSAWSKSIFTTSIAWTQAFPSKKLLAQWQRLYSRVRCVSLDFLKLRLPRCAAPRKFIQSRHCNLNTPSGHEIPNATFYPRAANWALDLSRTVRWVEGSLRENYATPITLTQVTTGALRRDLWEKISIAILSSSSESKKLPPRNNARRRNSPSPGFWRRET